MSGFISKCRANKLLRLSAGERGRNVWAFGFVILLSVLAAAFEGASFGFLSEAMTGLQGTGNSSAGFLRKWFLSHLEGSKLFFFSAIFTLLFQVLRSVLTFASTVFSTRLAVKVQSTIQNEVYNQILGFSYGYISRQKIGDLLENARAPVHFVNPFLECLNRGMVALLASAVIIGFMFLLDFRLTLVTLVVFGIFAFMQKSLAMIILRSSDALSKKLMEINQDSSQVLQGIKLIQTYVQQSQIKEKIKKKIESIQNTSKKMYILANVLPCLNETFSVSVLGLILVFAVVFIGTENNAFFPVLITFLAVTYRLSTRVQNAIAAFGLMSTYFGYMLRTNDILKDQSKEFLPTGGERLDQPIQEIAFKDVGFRYHGSSGILHNVSFSIPKGCMLGVVGLSGSGKTSLIDLLLRLYEPTHGAIYANGEDIRNFSLESWRAKFGVVAQDSFLFDESIEENIRFGTRGASFEQVVAAARAAEIDDFIQSLPLGYQTKVGERGVRLSGGERQRIALARSLLRNPEILILDEATSNLDSKSEHHIHRVLENMRAKKTIIMIAHRLSTVIHSDVILVIERGMIIGRGTHSSLLTECERYADLWNLQINKNKEALNLISNRDV